MSEKRKLHSFLMSKAEQMTEEWYEKLDKSDPSGVYSSTDPVEIKKLKGQNFAFHENAFRILIEEESEVMKRMESWILETTSDPELIDTPIEFIIREFMRTRDVYFGFIKEFVDANKESMTIESILYYYELIISITDQAIVWYTHERNRHLNEQLGFQKEVINTLSSPVIVLSDDTALLPIIGELDSDRAKLLLENTLEQCVAKGINKLYIDLSGMVMVDSIVAQQLLGLLQSLELIGVEPTLSGIRPEIALTAIKLGISFENVRITSKLSQAIQPC
ncbi:STAS domain-containing protein [Sporosarcina highlanderae]|uniref:STAS domain-containing protein n=1 Tax=Sporosarcina highlanderae TaxID=3035916 RepID=A0ABT8JT17_9BACL|nr:STAS domain-containing protein [Sporosarcina highlanderae]MDN4608224.1 STAS domain-containing protein [Sporosarcina highlanderae]